MEVKTRNSFRSKNTSILQTVIFVGRPLSNFYLVLQLLYLTVTSVGNQRKLCMESTKNINHTISISNTKYLIFYPQKWGVCLETMLAMLGRNDTDSIKTDPFFTLPNLGFWSIGAGENPVIKPADKLMDLIYMILEPDFLTWI